MEDIVFNNKFFVTTAIDYVNAAPHLGHAYEKIAADFLARFKRARGYNVRFLTGVDEHGSKIQLSAQACGLAPQSFCDQRSLLFRRAWQCLNIVPDRFIRTTDGDHRRTVQQRFQRLRDQGDIYRGVYTGQYCEGCEDFLRKRDLTAEGLCPNHLRAPTAITEENYFFRLGRYKDAIRKWLEDNPLVVQPEGRRLEVLNQLSEDGLADFSISRSRQAVEWGIPVPDDADQVIYVWFDALLNYLTGSGDEAQPQQYWSPDLQLVGKDIIKFHAVYWPAILLAAGLPLPERIFAHGFITIEGRKLSKSLGNVIDPVALTEKYGADAVRYFLLAKTSFAQDGDFSEAALKLEVNAALANNLGNLLNRTLTLVEKHCAGRVPAGTIDAALQEACSQLEPRLVQAVDRLDFASALAAIIEVGAATNKYFGDKAPWSLYKTGRDREGADVLLTVLEVLRRIALYLHPATPALSEAVLRQLGFDGADGWTRETVIPAGQSVRRTGPVFARID